MSTRGSVTRRQLLSTLPASAVAGLCDRSALAQAAVPGQILMRKIPSTGESIPLIGLGTWITFNVGDDVAARDASAEVMRAFFDAGGKLVDSSPMYGSSQGVVGHGLSKLHATPRVFAADKVWIGSGTRGPAQIEASRRLWQLPRFDLLQVHNLLAWQEHLPTLFAMKAAGQLRYVGITTSHGRRHDEVERIMRSQPLDFVQITYNAIDRGVEQRILPLALERGIADSFWALACSYNP